MIQLFVEMVYNCVFRSNGFPHHNGIHEQSAAEQL